jgi:hypothetical protein
MRRRSSPRHSDLAWIPPGLVHSPKHGEELDMVTLKDGKILDKWSTMIFWCQGEEEGFLRAVEANLAAWQAPGVFWKRETVSPGWLKGLMGKRRDFLLVSHERFDDYTFFVSARDYGTSLDISWYLAASQKNALAKLAVSYVPGSALFNLDVFDQQDLTAYVTVGHRAVRMAVEDLLQKKHLDMAIDWKSKGMLAVS